MRYKNEPIIKEIRLNAEFGYKDSDVQYFD